MTNAEKNAIKEIAHEIEICERRISEYTSKVVEAGQEIAEFISSGSKWASDAFSVEDRVRQANQSITGYKWRVGEYYARKSALQDALTILACAGNEAAAEAIEEIKRRNS